MKNTIIVTEIIEHEMLAKTFRQRAALLSEAALRVRCASACARLKDGALAAAIEAERLTPESARRLLSIPGRRRRADRVLRAA